MKFKFMGFEAPEAGKFDFKNIFWIRTADLVGFSERNLKTQEFSTNRYGITKKPSELQKSLKPFEYFFQTEILKYLNLWWFIKKKKKKSESVVGNKHRMVGCDY